MTPWLQRKSTGSLRVSVYHLTCVNFLYATLYALEIKNTSLVVSSLCNWLITLAFTLHLILHLDSSQRARGWLLLLLGALLPAASAHACHLAHGDCTAVIGTASAPHSLPRHLGLTPPPFFLQAL